ncbi:MAG: hypothetical protein WCI45_11980 [Desulfuromonadales bacterium]
MKKTIKILAWALVAVNTANLFFSFAFRINRFLDQYAWWIKRGHKNYLGKDQSLLSLTSSVFSDYLFVLPYMVIALLVSIGFIRNSQSYKGLKKGVLLGLFISGALSSGLIALSMIPHSHEILQDGTAEWAMAWIPFIWIGYPSLVAGAIVGLVIAFAHKMIVHRK